MEIIFCIMLFAMGAVFGSFLTLAVYRIPLGLDITHERSFCPNCNHRLEFMDLIPIVSYLFLRGKCRYCGKPVRIRYLLLEVISGCVFLTAYFAFSLSFPFFKVPAVAFMIAFVMFYITNAILLGIDKEYRSMDRRVLLFGILTNTLYMLYLYTFSSGNLYRYGIYLGMMLIVFCWDTWTLKKQKKSYYGTQMIMLLIYEISFLDNLKMILGMLIGSILVYVFYQFCFMKRQDKKQVPIGFCISISAILSVLIGNLVLF